MGKTRSGKSFAVKKRLAEWAALGTRIVAVDPCDEYSAGRGGPLKDRVTAAELAADPKLLTKARLSLAVVPAQDTIRGWARAFRLVAGLLRVAGAAQGRVVVLVADEVGAWADHASGPECAAARQDLIALATNGRHRGIAMVLIAQRASMIVPSVRAQLSEIVTFRQDEPADLSALAERIGREQAAAAARLAQFRSITWRDDLEAAPLSSQSEKEEESCSPSLAS